MNDLISRQAAIDALHMHLMYRMGTDSNKKRLDDWINSLPSAQETHEERTETHACDLIDRQAVINAINTWDKFGVDERCRIVRWYEGLEPYVHLRDVLTAIVNLTAAQPQWIPCSERLPDEFGEYLVTKKAIGWNCEEYNSNDIAYFDNEGFNKADKVLAWMPFPKPYGGESE